MDDLWQHLLAPPESAKEERFHMVAWAMATSLLRSSPDEVTVADLARKAGVSRAWIYKYMGDDPEQRLAFTVRLFGEAFASPADEQPCPDAAAWRARVESGTRKGFDDVLKVPWCVLVYVRYRQSRHPLGRMIRNLEQLEVASFIGRMPAEVRSDHARAQAFAWAFHAARLGTLHQWLDPDFREAVGTEPLVDTLMGMVDRYLRENEETRSPLE